MWDSLLSNLAFSIPTTVLIAIAMGLIRNIFGWWENAWKDGKFSDYELKQLGGTIVKYFCGILLLSIGLPLEQAAALTFGLDVVTSSIKSVKNGNNK